MLVGAVHISERYGPETRLAVAGDPDTIHIFAKLQLLLFPRSWLSSCLVDGRVCEFFPHPISCWLHATVALTPAGRPKPFDIAIMDSISSCEVIWPINVKDWHFWRLEWDRWFHRSDFGKLASRYMEWLNRHVGFEMLYLLTVSELCIYERWSMRTFIGYSVSHELVAPCDICACWTEGFKPSS